MTALTLNQELNGIEIKFECKPLQTTLEGLKKLGFRWHKQKKLWYAKNTPERLELAQAIVEGAIYAEKIRKEEPKKAKPEPINKFGVKVGDVFYESWGWEQTNIDFWQVVALKGKTQLVLKAISSEIVEQVGYCSNMVRPVKNSWSKHYAGEEITRTVKGTPENPYCNAKHGLLWKTTWDAEHNETSYY